MIGKILVIPQAASKFLVDRYGNRICINKAFNTPNSIREVVTIETIFIQLSHRRCNPQFYNLNLQYFIWDLQNSVSENRTSHLFQAIDYENMFTFLVNTSQSTKTIHALQLYKI